MDVNEDTPAELQPIFTLLNSHSNKLYQEGYFLKLDDQDIRGKPNPDRTWTECFAQLVGTVLSLWDAAELDAAGEDGEVLPKFINLTDASIKMIESLPTKSNDEQPLQNILSISTAGRNRYLLHFNSHHSLVQWTSGIRLAMFEHTTLQEAYTGALVAGKGKALNSINIIMERARQPVQEWVRVRFGAGVPWRRCWCVIEPPNEKEFQKAQKEFKKKNPYNRSHGPVLKGEIRFYDTKKESEKKKKHQRPIASITDAYSAYAIYPQSKALVDGSTLLKIEGDITIHSSPPSSTEGFVFIMPETHPAVPGFETLLRFLFPTWDTFALYGRPGRLVASVLDSRSLMFAMPKHKKYGYLEVMDVNGLLSTNGNSLSERDWRKRLKELTGQRMAAVEDGTASPSRSESRNSKRLSYGSQAPAPARPRVGFADDNSSVRSSRSQSVSRPGMRNDSAPPDPNRERAPSAMAGHSRHSRNISDTQIGDTPAFSSDVLSSVPPSLRIPERVKPFASDLASTPERISSEEDSPLRSTAAHNLNEMQRMETPEPVNAPPAFAHSAGSLPQQKPIPSPEMRRATNRLSHTTLSQLAKAGGLTPELFSDQFPERQLGGEIADQRSLAVQPQTSANTMGMNANFNGSREALTSPTANPYPNRDYYSGPPPPHMDPAQNRSNSPFGAGPREPLGNSPPAFRPGPSDGSPPDSRYPPPSARRTPSPGRGRQYFPQLQGGSPPINRKPLPARTSSLSHGADNTRSPVVSPSPPANFPSYTTTESLFRALGDESTPSIPTQYPRRPNNQRIVEGGYDDASSTASPDYASTRRSTETQESVDRPRAGVFKTIGDDPEAGPAKAAFDIPEINFGPTLNYSAPGKNPPSRGNDSANRPFPPAAGRRSPGPAPAYSHFRQESDDTVRRSVVWQPGTTIGSPSTDNILSPEQFVQQRAAAAGQYAHQRSPSAGTLLDFNRAVTPTSPYKRPGSRGPGHSRHSSAELLTSGRPVSQGTAAALSGGEVSSHLSAREQEHVARVTGSSLITLAGNRGPSQTQSGLVGAIQSRERERAQMKHGIGGQAVAQAIDQRQREQNLLAQRAAQAAYAQQQAQFAAGQQALSGRQTPMGMGGMGGGAPSVYGMGGPAPSAYGMGGAAPSVYGMGGTAPSTYGMGGAAPSAYAPSMAGMNVRSMSPGPGMISQVSHGQGQGFQPRPQMMPHQGSYNMGSPQQGGPGYSPGSGWNMNNAQRSPGPMMPSPGFAVQGGRPHSPGFPGPPQGQYSPGGIPGGARPGTPGRMQPPQGQAF
ncbi:hypothetical protein BT67DRAFT_387018 [Trichocladium antarcticum]|uniref:PH domain-containing protein n=1 Tax=Trichocladium antarcticum TaxID=1450529 RepID=A0AAN6ZC15_9PEZI|nr:hypothetical protein BT67DRAFT_387018 [Trichocladium antarcticum]